MGYRDEEMVSQEPRAIRPVVEVWAATVGSNISTADSTADATQEPAPLATTDIATFVASMDSHLKEWAQLFSRVPNEHERRKEALGGALKLKQAAKRFEKLTAGLT